ncbi:unnamed protein product, partial [Rotaria socialis]
MGEKRDEYILLIFVFRPFVRKLINKFDYEALDIKMLKAKELFYLMADKSQKLAPKGYVPLRALCVELAAGGVERDNIEHVSIIQSIAIIVLDCWVF